MDSITNRLCCSLVVAHTVVRFIANYQREPTEYLADYIFKFGKFFITSYSLDCLYLFVHETFFFFYVNLVSVALFFSF